MMAPRMPEPDPTVYLVALLLAAVVPLVWLAGVLLKEFALDVLLRWRMRRITLDTKKLVDEIEELRRAYGRDHRG
jgi:hypothetical protein